jgi:glutathione peroxidase
MSIYNIVLKDITGNEVKMSEFSDKVLLVVNTASKCGFTPQYTGLEKLYENYKDKGLLVLGFPCNQFGAQEPGSSEEIQDFCTLNFDIKFPMFEKVEVNGKNTHPLYQYLKEAAPGLLGSKKIKWNFTKFLIGKSSSSIKRYAPNTEPENIEKDIKIALDI